MREIAARLTSLRRVVPQVPHPLSDYSSFRRAFGTFVLNTRPVLSKYNVGTETSNGNMATISRLQTILRRGMDKINRNVNLALYFVSFDRIRLHPKNDRLHTS